MGLWLPERLHSFLTRKLWAPPATATRSFWTRGQDATVMTVGSRRPGPATIHPNTASALGTSAPQTSSPVARWPESRSRARLHFALRSGPGAAAWRTQGRAELSCKGVWEKDFILHLLAGSMAPCKRPECSGFYKYGPCCLSPFFTFPGVNSFIFTSGRPTPSPALEVPLGS